jgi:hypothetical protein
MPRSGLERDGATPITSASTCRRSPARTGFSQRSSSKPGEHAGIPDETKAERQGLKTADDQAAIDRFLGGDGIGVKRLRIVVMREVEDHRLGDLGLGGGECIADREVVEEPRHGAIILL